MDLLCYELELINMKKLNLKELKFYTNLSKEEFVIYNIQQEISNFIYKNMIGIAFHAFALKIWNSDGVVEINEEEEKLLKEVMNYLKPFVIDALEEQLSGDNTSEDRV